MIIQPLTIHTDGGSRGNPGPAATGVVILDDSGNLVHEFGRYLGIATNNEAEYLAVIDALNWIISSPSPAVASAKEGIPPLSFLLDSKLVVEQVSRRWKIKEARLFQLATTIWNLIQTNNLSTTFTYIPRAQNSAADKQVNLALDANK